MGKDGDKKGSSAGSESRDEMKAEHTRLVGEERALHGKYEEVQSLFKKLEDAYSASKETFTLNRYSQLKDMIKVTASDDVIAEIRNTVQQSQSSSGGGTGESGMSSLLKRAQDFSSGSQQQEQKESTTKSTRKSGKMSGLMKKLKNMTGFSDDPIADEDVMTNSDLQRDNGRKQRAISRYQTQLGKAAAKLERLQKSYQASKAHAPPKRYQELKDMIKACVAEKLV